MLTTAAHLVIAITATTAPYSADDFNDVVAGYHERGEFDGAAIVIRDEQTIYSGAFGPANRTWDIRSTSETKFWIASVTKQFTAVLILQLIGEGEIGLDDPVTAHLPWYREDTGDRITVRHLLQHLSGLPEAVTEFDQVDDALDVAADARKLVEKFASRDLLFEPGSQFNYSNADYYVLGAIVEETTGLSFEDTLRERILDPLGMQDTGMRRYQDVVPRMATGYKRSGDTYEHGFDLGQLGYAAAGMYSTVEDLAKWYAALLQHRVLSEELTELMLTPTILEGDTGGYVALGSWVYPRALPPEYEQAPRIVERRGYVSPFTALTVFCPDDGHAFVLLSNTDPSPIHELPYAQGLPLDLLLMLYEKEPLGPPAE